MSINIAYHPDQEVEVHQVHVFDGGEYVGEDGFPYPIEVNLSGTHKSKHRPETVSMSMDAQGAMHLAYKLLEHLQTSGHIKSFDIKPK